MTLDWKHGELKAGLDCFHSGAFFAAHEHWELVWLAAPEPEKTFLQALIQVAAAFHHFQTGNLAGTSSLLRAALRRLQAYPEIFAGVAVAKLRDCIQDWLESPDGPEDRSHQPMPRIELTGHTVERPVNPFSYDK